jgi:hypothetical protein
LGNLTVACETVKLLFANFKAANRARMSTNTILILIGIVSFVLGIYVTQRKIRIFRNGKQDRFGVDFQLLILGALCIVLGMALIGHVL